MCNCTLHYMCAKYKNAGCVFEETLVRAVYKHCHRFLDGGGSCGGDGVGGHWFGRLVVETHEYGQVLMAAPVRSLSGRSTQLNVRLDGGSITQVNIKYWFLVISNLKIKAWKLPDNLYDNVTYKRIININRIIYQITRVLTNIKTPYPLPSHRYLATGL